MWLKGVTMVERHSNTKAVLLADLLDGRKEDKGEEIV